MICELTFQACDGRGSSSEGGFTGHLDREGIKDLAVSFRDGNSHKATTQNYYPSNHASTGLL
jgi:hypothetical protein